MADDLHDDMTDDELAEVLADFDDDELDELEELAEEPDGEPEAVRAYVGFDRLVSKLRARGHSEDSARRIAASIGRRKYGKKFDQLRQMSRKARMRLEKTMRSQATDMYDRVWALDDIEIVRGGKGGDGRTVAAYAAIYGVPTEVRDQHGHYMEVIDRSAFRRTLQHGDITRRVTVLYNHGLGLNGEHHPLGSVPIGSPVEIRSDDKGLYTVTRFNRSDLADAVLEAIKAGDIRGYSFRGRVFRSTPERVPRIQRGQLPTIVRNELGLSEYGPTPIPYYADAAVVAVRSRAIADAMRTLPVRERITIVRSLLEDLDDENTEPQTTTPETEVEPEEGTETETSTTPDPDDADIADDLNNEDVDETDEDTEVEDPEDESPTDSDESPGTEGPPEEAPLPVSQAARSISAAEVARKARVALILRGGK